MIITVTLNDCRCMDLKVLISVSISIAGFIFGIIWKVAEMSIKLGKMQQRLDNNEERDREERAHASVKFSELYNRMANHDALISGLANNVTTLSSTCSRIESKLDRLIEKKL